MAVRKTYRPKKKLLRRKGWNESTCFGHVFIMISQWSLAKPLNKNTCLLHSLHYTFHAVTISLMSEIWGIQPSLERPSLQPNKTQSSKSLRRQLATPPGQTGKMAKHTLHRPQHDMYITDTCISDCTIVEYISPSWMTWSIGHGWRIFGDARALLP